MSASYTDKRWTELARLSSQAAETETAERFDKIVGDCSNGRYSWRSGIEHHENERARQAQRRSALQRTKICL